MNNQQTISNGLNYLSHSVISAAIEVHRALGPGFLETIYEESLCVELRSKEISFIRQAPVKINYKSQCVGEHRLDFLIEDALVLEIKATSELAPIHSAQVLSYLKATGKQLGLLINFNVPMLVDGIKRIILT
jgi:GxxExxY protein